MMNALKHIRKQFEQAWRHGAGDPDNEDAPGEYSHVKKGDVKVLVDALKAHFGGGIDEAGEKAAAFADDDQTNPFAANQRLLLPWTKIAKKGMKNLHHHPRIVMSCPSPRRTYSHLRSSQPARRRMLQLSAGPAKPECARPDFSACASAGRRWATTHVRLSRP